jgi:single-strand DNA-binding protein
MAVARYTLAVDRTFKKEGEQAADFINCIAFGKNGEFAEKYLYQGTKIIVEGRWQTGNYTNKDGQKVYTNDCVVERHEFAESKNSNSNSDNGSSSRPVPNNDDGFMSIPDGLEDEGLPF